ncbi:SDR family oxidoreductase [Temperatibacter marinus]|uniref:SDR family oxidoreductase n=1 Tax=Temperatibacter marinus TaxID=1456591 RepID=A0AA52H9L7_9PROT|nr:SDR family oxidoreductase [Temperatibacter marinus]WND01820.1 SDR family oxidoreductase [Temperatibacter marinus]
MANFEQLFDISGKVALVTGGGSGIGEMMTEALVEAGCKVFIASRKYGPLKEVADRLNAIGPGTVDVLTADLSTEEGLNGLVSQLKEATSKLDILCNNSGATWGAATEDYPREAWDKIININLTAVGDLTLKLAPLLEKSGSKDDPSRIINTGSVMGTRAMASSGGANKVFSYNASKAAVHHLTKVFANEFTQKNITVNAIAPGPFQSRMMAFATDTEEKRDMMGKTVPLGRIGSPDDMTCVIRYLCSKGGGYITGAIIPIDGGISAMP